jgi:hypothetical protein
MAQEQSTTPKSQLKCRDCSVDIDKLLEAAEQATGEPAEQAPPKPPIVFDLSLMGGGLAGQAEESGRGNDDAS